MTTSDLTPADSHEPNLQKTPAERCRAYGVKLERDHIGWWATHPYAGHHGPFDTEDRAARNACAKWSI